MEKRKQFRETTGKRNPRPSVQHFKPNKQQHSQQQTLQGFTCGTLANNNNTWTNNDPTTTLGSSAKPGGRDGGEGAATPILFLAAMAGQGPYHHGQLPQDENEEPEPPAREHGHSLRHSASARVAAKWRSERYEDDLRVLLRGKSRNFLQKSPRNLMLILVTSQKV